MTRSRMAGCARESIYLNESNVHRLASVWWNNERGVVPVWEEDPTFLAASEWLSVDSFDYTMFILAKRLFLAAVFGESQQTAYHVVNTDKSGRSGSHWFTVVYEIGVADTPPAGQLTLSASAAQELDVDRNFLSDLKDDHVPYFRSFDLSPLIGRAVLDVTGDAMEPGTDDEHDDPPDEVDRTEDRDRDTVMGNAHASDEDKDEGVNSADEDEKHYGGDPVAVDYYASEAEDFDE